jgi:hypothetical protein
MGKDQMQVRLTRDRTTIAATCAAAGYTGSSLICHGCANVAAPITGLLVADADEEAWALCPDCLGTVPLLGAVA